MLMHQTLILEVFLVMNIFNLFNCRRLSCTNRSEVNLLSEIIQNWHFLVVVLAAANIMYGITHFRWLSFLFRTTQLTFEMHILSLVLGLGSIAVATLAKIMPIKYVPTFSDTESEDAKVTRISFSSLDGGLSLQKQTSKALLAEHNKDSKVV